jgi:hypothetical protein
MTTRSRHAQPPRGSHDGALERSIHSLVLQDSQICISLRTSSVKGDDTSTRLCETYEKENEVYHDCGTLIGGNMKRSRYSLVRRIPVKIVKRNPLEPKSEPLSGAPLGPNRRRTTMELERVAELKRHRWVCSMSVSQRKYVTSDRRVVSVEGIGTILKHPGKATSVQSREANTRDTPNTSPAALTRG